MFIDVFLRLHDLVIICSKLLFLWHYQRLMPFLRDNLNFIFDDFIRLLFKFHLFRLFTFFTNFPRNIEFLYLNFKLFNILHQNIFRLFPIRRLDFFFINIWQYWGSLRSAQNYCWFNFPFNNLFIFSNNILLRWRRGVRRDYIFGCLLFLSEAIKIVNQFVDWKPILIYFRCFLVSYLSEMELLDSLTLLLQVPRQIVQTLPISIAQHFNDWQISCCAFIYDV